MTGTTETVRGPSTAVDHHARRWWVLGVIGLAQLMIILDGTIVNIALPSAQKSLGVSDGSRQWIVTAYMLAFGSLLLLGGRIADYTGRKRSFMIGLIGFAAASALGGAATTFGLLLAARALQGVFGALLAPSTLSLLAVTFSEPKDRAKAFGVFGAIAAGGSAVGLVLGGVLTEYLNWRWCLYVNIPVAALAFTGAWFLIDARLTDAPRPESAKGSGPRFDIPGVLLATSGLVSIVYACSRAETDGWHSTVVVSLLVGGAALLALFAFVESKVAQPLLPLRVVLNRTRGSAYLAVGLAVIGMFGLFLFLTFYFQLVCNYSPVMAGTAFLPMSAMVLVSAGGISSRLLPRVPPRMLMVPGLLIAGTGMLLLTRLSVNSSYAGGVLPSELMLGFGMGLVMAPAMNYATYGVQPQDAGVASASINTAQQVGGSIGTALLNTIAASASATYLASHHGHDKKAAVAASLVHGFATATAWAAGILFTAAVFVAVVMNTPKPVLSEKSGEDHVPVPHMA